MMRKEVIGYLILGLLFYIVLIGSIILFIYSLIIRNETLILVFFIILVILLPILLTAWTGAGIGVEEGAI